jgi:hypothetical protein
MKRSKGCGSKGSRRRGKRGGGMAPLETGAFPGQSAGQWSTSVSGNPAAQAAGQYQSFLGKFANESGGAGANPALAREMVAGYAMNGPGQTGGGSRRHKRHHKRGKRHGSRRMRMSQSQAQAQGQSQAQAQAEGQSGGMFATFGALLKEALVPLGLLAAQQTYGKSYDKKRRTRKNRK